MGLTNMIFKDGLLLPAAVSRRSLLKGAAVTSAGLLAATAFPGMSFSQSAPKRGGHLILGLDTASSSDRIDPATYTEAYMYNVGFQVFNTLVEMGEGGKLEPSLAESWEPTRPDASEWRFKLRKGVQFHNGKELDAKDVLYSINHHRGEDSKSGAKGQLTSVVEMRETAPMEITFTLAGGNADFPYTLTDVHLGITHDGADFDKGIGTGAFVLEDFQPGVRALTKRFENHWNPQRGLVDSVETIGMNDATARVSALMSGRAHIINRLDPKASERLTSMQQFRIHRTEANTIHCFPMRCDTAPFDNVDLRQSLKHAMDREMILRNGYGGFGVIGNDTPIAPWNPYFSADVPKNDYDPDKARSLMKKSGYSGPIEIAVSDNGFPGSVGVAQLYQAAAKKADIDLVVNRVPSDGYWEDTWMKKPFCASNWAVRPTADAMLSMILHSNAPWNETYFKNADFDSKLEAARGELDQVKRKALYHDLQVIQAEQGGYVVPIFVDQLLASAANVEGIVNIPGGGDLSGNRVAEKVWFNA